MTPGDASSRASDGFAAIIARAECGDADRRRRFRLLPSLKPGLDDELGVEIGFDRLQPAFGAVARILHAAERHLREARGRGG